MKKIIHSVLITAAVIIFFGEIKDSYLVPMLIAKAVAFSYLGVMIYTNFYRTQKKHNLKKSLKPRKTP